MNERIALTDDQKLDWMQLSRTDSIGPITFYRLMQKYKSVQKALAALPHLSKTKPVTAIDRGLVEKEYRETLKQGGRIIAACEPDYPEALAATEDAPPVLTVFGDASLLHKPSIAIVGSRNCSLNGRKFAEKLARELGESGYVITSGLARGIDAAAHVGGLKTGTVAAVAGGADVIYPRENEDLHVQIAKKGAVISEVALGLQPLSKHFPKRNRIITGLSLGVIVVEANLKSGSLISARTAAEQGRDVFAVPGFPADPRAEGPNALLKDGAILVQSTLDVLNHVQSFAARKVIPKSFSDGLFDTGDVFEVEDENAIAAAAETILTFLSHTPVAVDEIVRACQLTIATVQSSLLELELSGQVKRHPGNRVSMVEYGI